MKRVFDGLLFAAAALMVIAPAWAQAPMPPSSPDDPLSRIHGWVEPAPGSQAAKPAPAPEAAKPAPGPQAAKPAPEAIEGPATARTEHPVRTAKHARPVRHEPERVRRPSASDRMADQLNRQELGNINAGRSASPAPRR